MIYIIAYDLKEPSTPNDYERVIAAIKSYGNWCRLEQSTWLVDAPKQPLQIRDELLGFVRPNDILFVGRVPSAAWNGMDADRQSWLNARAW